MKDRAFSLKTIPLDSSLARGRYKSGTRSLGALAEFVLVPALVMGYGCLANGQTAVETGSGSASSSASPPAFQSATPAASAAPLSAAQSLPNAPAPAAKKPSKRQARFDACSIENTGASMTATGGLRAASVLGIGNTEPTAGATPVRYRVCADFRPIDWYERFVTGPSVMRFSPEQKLRLAVMNLMDPFNLLTVVGEASISIAADSHSPYGPGFRGWGKLSGANFTQDMTDQFFGTFLIPAVTQTDPHYHRRPDLKISRRILHAVTQTFWQRDDNGRNTFNYSQIVAPVFDIAISNLYVPGVQTRFTGDVTQYTLSLATAPIDNFITEFVPSIASRIHTRVVLVQRVIDQVAASPP